MLSKLMLSVPLLFLASAVPQTLTSGPPPIKMGLWETTIGGGPGPGYKARSCITPESYQRAFAGMPAACTISNQTRTARHASGDIDCKFNNVQSSGHFDIDFPDSETVHSKTTMTMTVQGKTMPMSSEVNAKFISSDCGSVAPGKPQIFR